jgi:hypothetical protein
MRGSVKEALDYTKESEQGGSVIIKWSEVWVILANMTINY